MAKIVWLASYPKSGNTWLRILLAGFLKGGAADINALRDINDSRQSGGFSRAALDRYCAFKTSCLGNAVADRLRPDIYRVMAAEAGGDLLLKVHDAWRYTDRGDAVFPADCTKAVIYVLRNVLDVAASAASHWGVEISEAVENLCDAGFTLGRSRKRLLPGVIQPLSSWSRHVRSWCEESGLPVHIVRYEDLQADTAAAFAKVLAFCDMPVDDARIAAAVDNARFERLKDVEQITGFSEHSGYARGSFFRKGKAGGWREELTAGQVRRLVDAHGDVMRRFGYLDSKGAPL